MKLFEKISKLRNQKRESEFEQVIINSRSSCFVNAIKMLEIENDSHNLLMIDIDQKIKNNITLIDLMRSEIKRRMLNNELTM